MRKSLFAVVLIAGLLTMPQLGSAADIPVFPGAQGPGAETPGGRGGEIIEVTNLDDSGPGSLRAAINAEGPRIVVFRVAGIIELESRIRIDNPYLYIAGQTAPGGGIVLHDKVGSDQTTGMLRFDTHDIVVRFVRFRSGFGQKGGADNITIAGANNHIVVDHCSFSWTNDESIGIWSLGSEIHHITMSWNLMAEALNHHSTALLVGSQNTPEKVRDIGIHHNFFTSNSHRNPWTKNNDARIINNLVYNWRHFGTAFSDGMTVDVIGNRYVPGSETSGRPSILHSLSQTQDSPGVDGELSLYIAGNRDHEHTDPSADNWEMVERADDFSLTGNQPPRDRRRDSPMSGGTFSIQPEPVDRMQPRVLQDAGAAYRLDAHGDWIPNRDEVDERLVQEFHDGGGAIPEDEQEVGGLPDIADGSPYADADGDGVADRWEDEHGFDNSDADDGDMDADGDGYTNVEEFLNGSDPRQATGRRDGAVGLDGEEQTEFSDVETFGDRDNYTEKTPARWRVLSDRGDLRYGLITSAFEGDDGRLGEHSVVPDETFGDVEVTARVRSTENFEQNGGADYVLILGYIDADNYYYAMFNRSSGSSGLYRFENGGRTELAVVDDRVIGDNDYHEVTFARNGDRLTMEMDGEQLAEARDTNLGEGAIGVGAFNDSAYFDDVRVATPEDDPGADAGGTGDAGTADTGTDVGGVPSDTGSAPDGTSETTDATDDGPAETGAAGSESDSGCSQTGAGQTPVGFLAVVFLGLAGLLRRRFV